MEIDCFRMFRLFPYFLIFTHTFVGGEYMLESCTWMDSALLEKQSVYGSYLRILSNTPLIIGAYTNRITDASFSER